MAPVKFSFSERHNDIVIAELMHNINIDLQTAKDIVAQRLSYASNKKHYLVANVSHVLSISAEAKKYLQEPENGQKNILGAALVASSPLSALIANVFIKTPTNFKSRFFTKMEDAMRWILDQKEKESLIKN